jgi:hypothetical protein
MSLALLIPMIPAILLELFGMNLIHEALVHVSQSSIGRSGGGVEVGFWHCYNK